MTMTDVLMPALSPTMEEGTLAKWLVKIGDEVRPGDIIAEIETDKATMDMEAIEEGTVDAILVLEGSEGVKVNTPIARLTQLGGNEGEPALVAPVARPSTAPAADKQILSPAARRIVGEHGLDASGISGTGRAGRITKADALAAAAKRSPAEASDQPVPDTLGHGPSVSPLANRLADQRGIDVLSVTGSGLSGRILKVDIDRATADQGQSHREPGARTARAEAPPTVFVPTASLEQQGIKPGSYDLVPLDGMRKTVARRMTESFRDVPHFPLTIDLEIDGLLAARTKINGLLEKEGVKVSVNDMVIKAAAVALKRVPEANASYTPEGIAMHHHADIAMAVAVPGGLITPIIFEAETKGLAEIAKEAKDLAERARTKKLKPEEFQGGTFSVSNLGMFGIKSFASIINEPQGAIMSVGVGEKRPVVRGDQLAIATVMSVTLTCDHRVVDGAVGARFLAAFRALIEDPMALLI
jgi:pyruvate dehydrogenase E2 component (dihydrolipoamide acetyltransferase)